MKRRRDLRDMILNLNRLNYQSQQHKHTCQEKVQEYQAYCNRFKNYVDFKINNHYSEHDPEFVTQPTPRSKENIQFPADDLKKDSRNWNLNDSKRQAYSKSCLDIGATKNTMTKNDLIKSKYYLESTYKPEMDGSARLKFLPYIKKQNEIILKKISIEREPAKEEAELLKLETKKR